MSPTPPCAPAPSHRHRARVPVVLVALLALLAAAAPGRAATQPLPGLLTLPYYGDPVPSGQQVFWYTTAFPTGGELVRTDLAGARVGPVVTPAGLWRVAPDGAGGVWISAFDATVIHADSTLAGQPTDPAIIGQSGSDILGMALVGDEMWGVAALSDGVYGFRYDGTTTAQRRLVAAVPGATRIAAVGDGAWVATATTIRRLDHAGAPLAPDITGVDAVREIAQAGDRVAVSEGGEGAERIAVYALDGTLQGVLHLANQAYALTSDGTHLWFLEAGTNLVHRLDLAAVTGDPSTATTDDFSGIAYPAALAFDGTRMWASDPSSLTGHRFDLPAGNPPVVTRPADATIPWGTAYHATVDATSPTRAPLTWSLTTRPNGATIDPATGAVDWTPTADQSNGIYTFTAAVDDGASTANATWSVRVTEHATSLAMAAPGPSQINGSVTVAAVLTDQLTAGPIAGRTVSFQVAGTAAGSAVTDSAGRAAATVSIAAQNTPTVPITASFTGDQQYLSSSGGPVNVPGLNGPPVVNAISSSVPWGVTLNLQVVANDPEGRPLTYALIGAPSGMTVDAATGAITWTPTAQQGLETTLGVNRLYAFRVRVSDGDTTTTRIANVAVTRRATRIALPAGQSGYSHGLTGPWADTIIGNITRPSAAYRPAITATLLDDLAGSRIARVTLRAVIGTASGSAFTYTGTASIAITIRQPAGPATAVVGFLGNALYLPGGATTRYDVTELPAYLAYTPTGGATITYTGAVGEEWQGPLQPAYGVPGLGGRQMAFVATTTGQALAGLFLDAGYGSTLADTSGTAYLFQPGTTTMTALRLRGRVVGGGGNTNDIWGGDVLDAAGVVIGKWKAQVGCPIAGRRC